MLTDKTFGQISQRWPVKYLRSIHVDKLFVFVSDTLETGTKIVSSETTFGVVADIKYELFSTFTLQKMACYGIHWPGVKT